VKTLREKALIRLEACGPHQARGSRGIGLRTKPEACGEIVSSPSPRLAGESLRTEPAKSRACFSLNSLRAKSLSQQLTWECIVKQAENVVECNWDCD
jgi:hypothetical protein